jgi:hypothetical protein
MDIKEVREISGLLRSAGAQTNYPLYLLPGLQHVLRPVDLAINVDVKENDRLTKNDIWHFFNHEQGRSSAYTVSGVIPDTAKKGDTFLVTVTAHYPEVERVAAKSVNFLEFLHVV